MKKYCLTPKAKRDLGNFAQFILTVIVAAIIFIMALSMFVAFVSMATGELLDNSQFILYMVYGGVSCWVVVLGLLSVPLKRWLQNSMEEC